MVLCYSMKPYVYQAGFELVVIIIAISQSAGVRVMIWRIGSL